MVYQFHLCIHSLGLLPVSIICAVICACYSAIPFKCVNVRKPWIKWDDIPVGPVDPKSPIWMIWVRMTKTCVCVNQTSEGTNNMVNVNQAAFFCASGFSQIWIKHKTTSSSFLKLPGNCQSTLINPHSPDRAGWLTPFPPRYFWMSFIWLWIFRITLTF